MCHVLHHYMHDLYDCFSFGCQLPNSSTCFMFQGSSHLIAMSKWHLKYTMQAPSMRQVQCIMDHQPLSLPMYAIAYRMSSQFSEHTFQMMRAVTRNSTKVSAMQGQHIICNNVLQHLLEAVGTGFMPAMTSKRGSPKDRGRIEGWDQCPLGYTYPDENETIAIIDGALESLITDLKKPLKRKGTGGKPFTIWREDLKVTAPNPLVLTRVAKRKARASSFLDSFPGWTDNYDALPHPREPCINWSDIPSLSASLDEDGSSTEDEDELQDAQSHVPLNAAARNSLGDGPAPEMVSACA
ncbi:TPA: hypothetical protein ACH3X1_015643 [Trebouxia sp. C0004]